MTIEVKTALSYEAYCDEFILLETQAIDAQMFICLSADTVARTIAYKKYDEWFSEQNADIWDYFAWSECEIGTAKGMMGCVDAREIDGPSVLVWVFNEDIETERNLAMLFKLTFGGTA